MKPRNLVLLIALTLILALTFAVPATYARARNNKAEPPKQETMAKVSDKIDVKDLPSAITDAVKSAYPNAEIEEAVRVDQGNGQVYRVKVEDNNVEHFLLYTPGGQLVEASENVDKDKLPAAIKASLERDYPNLDLEKVDKVTKNGVTTWEVIIEQNGQKQLVVLDESGNRLSTRPESRDIEDRMIGKDKD